MNMQDVTENSKAGVQKYISDFREYLSRRFIKSVSIICFISEQLREMQSPVVVQQQECITCDWKRDS